MCSTEKLRRGTILCCSQNLWIRWGGGVGSIKIFRSKFFVGNCSFFLSRILVCLKLRRGEPLCAENYCVLKFFLGETIKVSLISGLVKDMRRSRKTQASEKFI